MRRDDATGVWSVRGGPSWKGRYYTFLVTVYAPAAGKVVTNEVTDPYSLSLAADSVRSQLVDLADRSLQPEGWSSLAKPRPVPQQKASIYELHVRDFSPASDSSVPGRHGAAPTPRSPGERGGMMKGVAQATPRTA